MSKILKQKNLKRDRRKVRVRSKIFGVEDRPRISIFKSNRYFYAQAIDDTKGITICNIDGSKENEKPSKEGVSKLGTKFASILKEKNITKVVYDRNGYLYHGVVASFADALRENGIEV